MKKLTQAAAILTLGAACALPVLAQDTGSTATSSPASSVPAGQGMSAGPHTMDNRSLDVDNDNDNDNDNDDFDLGWVGLLGLAGLLGLRRRREDHDHVHRTSTAH